jgi:sarcosine/dimethylglycine N-methyltransferase
MDDLLKAVTDHWKERADLAPIRRLVEERGHEVGEVPPKVLATFDQLHVGQYSGTRRFLDWVAPVKGDRVLDLGAGLGGTARLLAAEFGCRVVAVEGSPELTESARELTRWTGQEEMVEHRCQDILDLELTAPFDIVLLQHVDMQVQDKGRLYAVCARHLMADARLVWHDWLAGSFGTPNYPLPWADSDALSFPATATEFETALGGAGLSLTRFEEMGRPSVDWLTATIYRMDSYLASQQRYKGGRFQTVARQRLAQATLRDNVASGKLLPFFGEATVM